MDYSHEIITKLHNKEYAYVLAAIKNVNINQLSDEQQLITIERIITAATSTLILSINNNNYIDVNDKHNLEIIMESFKVLRNGCAKGDLIQNKIIKLQNIFSVIHILLDKFNNFNQKYTIPNDNIKKQFQFTLKMIWQFIGNLCVMNTLTQGFVWIHFKDLFYEYFENMNNDNLDICTMIIYNIFINGVIDDQCRRILIQLIHNLDVNETQQMDDQQQQQHDDHQSTSLNKNNNSMEIEQHSSSKKEFLHIFLEYFLTDYKPFPQILSTLDDNERLLILYYIADYVKDQLSDVKKNITIELLQFICKDFRFKSDCILKTETTYAKHIQPREIVALLEIIANATANDNYIKTLATDGSLFLNVGCLLQGIHKIGKKSDNIFTPIAKLEQMAPNSMENSSIERDLSYQFKTMLIKTIGNLAYKNKKNQSLARELEIMLTILDCTHLDARNPLIKEWSILAIRNLCENNFDNQQIIAQMTKIGDADNSDILKEFNIDLGTLRIDINKK